MSQPVASLPWLFVLCALAGCEYCRCEPAEQLGESAQHFARTKVGPHLAHPNDEKALQRIREYLGKTAHVTTKLCGVPSRGLKNIEIEIHDHGLRGLPTPGTVWLSVKGQPIPLPSQIADAGADITPESHPGHDAGSRGAGTGTGIHATKALVCSGALFIAARAIVDDQGDVEDWEINSAEVNEVTTEGLEWRRPPSSDGFDFD